MKSYLAILAISAGLAAPLAAPVLAHHSFGAEFDREKSFEFTGVVTKVEWLNPHMYFYMDVEDDAGQVRTWAMEMGSPNGLMRNGWTQNTLKIGDEVTVEGSLARDGSEKGNASSVTLASGRRLFNGQNRDN
jgi:Family of unknown function (DUF6152)